MTRRTKGPKRSAEAYARSTALTHNSEEEKIAALAWMVGYRAASRARGKFKPFKVHVAIGGYNYESSHVLGVFMTRAGAEACTKHTVGYDYYEVEEQTVES